MLSISAGVGPMISFVAESDSQPRPDNYTMYLARIDEITNATTAQTKVAGMCNFSMTHDGKAWTHIVCQAQDADNASYALDFRPNRAPVAETRQ